MKYINFRKSMKKFGFEVDITEYCTYITVVIYKYSSFNDSALIDREQFLVPYDGDITSYEIFKHVTNKAPWKFL